MVDWARWRHKYKITPSPEGGVFCSGQGRQIVLLRHWLEMMQISKPQVCVRPNAHPGSLHQETKRGTSDASKSQLSQANCNRTVLKFDSGNQFNVNSYLSILFCDFTLMAQFWKVMSLWAGLDVCRSIRVKVPGIEECENFWHLKTQKLVLTKKKIWKINPNSMY